MNQLTSMHKEHGRPLGVQPSLQSYASKILKRKKIIFIICVGSMTLTQSFVENCSLNISLNISLSI